MLPSTRRLTGREPSANLNDPANIASTVEAEKHFAGDAYPISLTAYISPDRRCQPNYYYGLARLTGLAISDLAEVDL
jgi:hypothetical protein